MAPAPLYQDQFVDICQDHLNIKRYYFPFGQEKRITIGPGSGVSFATDRELGQKVWGMTLNNVWWALDWSRDPGLGARRRRLGVVITVRDETFRKGFSVEDEAAALRALKSVVPRTGQEQTEQPPQPPEKR